MRSIEPNAILADGPEPVGGRHVCTGPDTLEFRAVATDGTEHVWQRSYQLAPLKGCGWVRVYVHVGSPSAATARTVPAAGQTASVWSNAQVVRSANSASGSRVGR